nr:reverse transcriptase domain-containing protein [Tanacetum cinerariifolium]
MSTRSSARNLFPPLDNPKLTIRIRSRVDPTLLNDFEMATDRSGEPPVLDLRTIEELCQPTLNGRGGPIASIAIQATNFGLKNDMIQQVQNSCQFYGLLGNDANKHLDKFLHVIQSIKVNGVTDDALLLYLFPHSLTHHATAWRPEECYDLIKNMIAHHNDWDTSVQRSESSSSITSSSDPKIIALKAEMAKINKNLMKVLQINQQVKAVAHNYESCGGPHSYNDCLATVGQTRNVYAARAYNQGGSSYQPQGIKETIMEFFRGTTKEETNSKELVMVKTRLQLIKHWLIKPWANDAILKNMQTNMTSLINSNLKLKNMFGQFMKMNTASSSGSGTLPSNTITNSKEDLKGITTRSGNANKGSMIPTTSSPPKVVEHKTEVTKDTVPPTNNGSTKDIQPSIVQIETPISNSKTVIAPVVEPVEAPTGKALIDVYEGELTIRDGKEVVTFNLDQTSRYSANYDAMSFYRIDLIDVACEEYSQEVLGFSVSGNPTPSTKPIVSNSSPTLTPFGDSDFLLEETDDFLAVNDVPISPETDESYYDSEGDILLLKEFLNDDPSSPPLLPQELKVVERTNKKSSIDEPPVLELKDLPPHLEYAFLEGDDKLPVIIAKDLKDEEKTALIKVLKSHKKALTWVDPKIYEMTKKEVLKLLDVGLIYPISDSPWCEDPNLYLNWEKRHFIVKEGIVLGHKISKNGIEVDKSKLDVIAKLLHPTTVKGIRSFLGHDGFYR